MHSSHLPKLDLQGQTSPFRRAGQLQQALFEWRVVRLKHASHAHQAQTRPSCSSVPPMLSKSSGTIMAHGTTLLTPPLQRPLPLPNQTPTARSRCPQTGVHAAPRPHGCAQSPARPPHSRSSPGTPSTSTALSAYSKRPMLLLVRLPSSIAPCMAAIVRAIMLPVLHACGS